MRPLAVTPNNDHAERAVVISFASGRACKQLLSATRTSFPHEEGGPVFGTVPAVYVHHLTNIVHFKYLHLHETSGHTQENMTSVDIKHRVHV